MLFFNTSVITRITVIDFLWLWQIFCVLHVFGPVTNMGKWLSEMSRICQVPKYRCNMRTHADNSRSSPTSTIPGSDMDLVKHNPEQVGLRRNMTTLKFGAYQLRIELVYHDFKFWVFIKVFIHVLAHDDLHFVLLTSEFFHQISSLLNFSFLTKY